MTYRLGLTPYDRTACARGAGGLNIRRGLWFAPARHERRNHHTLPMKILVADDHALIREALCHVLGQLAADVNVIEAADSAAALRLAAEHTDLDLVLLDLNLPGVGGFAVLSELRAAQPALPVVVLSAMDEQRSVAETFARGALGFIPKSGSNAVMLGALRLVLAGGQYLPPGLISTLTATDRSRPVPLTVADLGLTARQHQVLALLAQGKSNRHICRELGLAEGTVKIHVTAILKALNVANRTQAVVALNRLRLKL